MLARRLIGLSSFSLPWALAGTGCFFSKFGRFCGKVQHLEVTNGSDSRELLAIHLDRTS